MRVSSGDDSSSTHAAGGSAHPGQWSKGVGVLCPHRQQTGVGETLDEKEGCYDAELRGSSWMPTDMTRAKRWHENSKPRDQPSVITPPSALTQHLCGLN
jgi:hypothetical protein